MSFSSELKAFTLKVEKNSEKLFRGTYLALFSSIIKRSPVGNPDRWVVWDKRTGRYLPYELVHGLPDGYVGGTFRGNWQTDINKIPNGTLDTLDKTGTVTIAKARLEASRAKIGDSIYAINNMPYAISLENGWSSKAPRGMVKITAAEFEREINKQARKLK